MEYENVWMVQADSDSSCYFPKEHKVHGEHKSVFTCPDGREESFFEDSKDEGEDPQRPYIFPCCKFMDHLKPGKVAKKAKYQASESSEEKLYYYKSRVRKQGSSSIQPHPNMKAKERFLLE